MAPTAVSARSDFGFCTDMWGAFRGVTKGFWARHDGKGTNQCSGKELATTDTTPRNGMGVSDNSAHRRQRNYPRQ
ncbi:hypothetical protein TUM20983_18580 [Mycobacterium antarcticum]|nr:hypothetical protein TUM20983_18580 [Mycolicibacterium sp. TUM20983]